jgi:hypothetical protein
MRGLVVGLAGLALVGCSTNALIRDSRFEHDAPILRSTPSEIIVRTNEGERAIPRAEIRDIDHPGNVLALAGVPILTLGLANLAGAWSCADRGPTDSFCFGTGAGFLTASIGALMVAFGAVIWGRSTARAGEPPARTDRQDAATSVH